MRERGRREEDITETPGGMMTIKMIEDITESTETETTMATVQDTGTVDTLMIITMTSLTTTDPWPMTAGPGEDLCTGLAVCLREISRAIKVIITTLEFRHPHIPGDLTVTWGTMGVISTALTHTWAITTTLKGVGCNEIVF